MGKACERVPQQWALCKSVVHGKQRWSFYILYMAEKLYVTPKSKLGEAVTYLLNQKKYLYNYLLDGRLESSNNRAERSVKPFVIARNNFLFANTANGAEGSSIIFSLIETAKENKLDPYRYLTHVLGLAPNLDESNTDWAEQLLPENAPEYCNANHRKK